MAPAATAVKKNRKSAPATVLVGERTIFRMTFSPDGRWIAATHGDPYLDLWDASTGRLQWRNRVGGNGMPSPHSVAFSPDSALVASGSSTVKVFSVADGAEKSGPEGHPKGELRDIVWTNEGILTAGGKAVRGSNTSIALWSPEGKLLRRIDSWKLPERAAFVPGNPDALLVCGRPHEEGGWAIGRVDLESGRTTAARETFPQSVNDFTVTEKGVWTSTTKRGVVERLDLESLEPVQAVETERDRVYAGNRESVFTGDEKVATVRRRGLDGSVLSTWTVPPFEGLEAWGAALMEAGKEPYLGRSEATSLCAMAVSKTGDRVAVAIGLAISIWTPDGEPVRMPSVT